MKMSRENQLKTALFTGILSISTVYTGYVSAAPVLRVQVEQKGDFLLIGNTLGQECAASAPVPIVGTVGMCGLNTEDTAPDVFWRSEEPGAGQALADISIDSASARSTAVLNLPTGALVTHAFLYWAASTMNADSMATLSRPDGFSQSVPAVQTFLSSNNSYQSVADVTSVVQQGGAGPYRVSDIKSQSLLDADSNSRFVGWWMVVFYSLPTDPPRNLALFDGLDFVSDMAPQDVLLSGLNVPPAFGQAKLGVVAYEGDGTLNGDQFFFNGVQLSNAVNPANNFFNGSRTFFGAPVSVDGDLPQLSGAPESMSGLDMDIVDITPMLTAGQTSAPVQATSTGDTYHFAGFVASIPALKPDFTVSTKTALDLNGEPTLAGDTIEYTLFVLNDGSDTSIQTVLTDTLPPQVAYLPSSITVTDGASTQSPTDISGDDICDFDGPTATITCRLGTGANAANGGNLLAGESVTVTFQVTVQPGFVGTFENQAVVTAAGEQGAPTTISVTDGNGDEPGAPPTVTLVDGCGEDIDCGEETPLCNLDKTPNECVECLTDTNCTTLLPVCDPGTGTCICVSSGVELCDGADNNCNGEIDEGMGLGMACTVGTGACATTGVMVCGEEGAVTCDAVPGMPKEESCGDDIDSDCDGDPDNGCEPDTGVTDPEGCGCRVYATEPAGGLTAMGLWIAALAFRRRRRP